MVTAPRKLAWPVLFLRRMTGDKRSRTTNRQLGCSLAFVAGAINAGGFLAVGQYTSHMSGILSSVADHLVTNQLVLVAVALGSLASFVAGAAYSAVLINWGVHHRTKSKYAYPLLWEALLLLGFGLLGHRLDQSADIVPFTVLLLCFIMGLQNAIITKVSNSEIRTTHMTGVITDIGIELGKAVYINSHADSDRYKAVRADWKKLGLLLALLAAFSLGGVAGAVGFSAIGYAATIPLAAFLIALATVPLADDVRIRAKVLTRRVRRRGHVAVD